MERKFTDDEIVKALGCCSDTGCEECPINNKSIMCATRLMEHALDLINRQKAEIERLQKIVNTHFVTTRRINEKCAIIERKHNIDDVCDLIKSEAIKEFAERLCDGRVSNDPVVIAAKCLLKEMTEEGAAYNGKPKQDS